MDTTTRGPRVRPLSFVLFWREVDAELRLLRMFGATAGEVLLAWRNRLAPSAAAYRIGLGRTRSFLVAAVCYLGLAACAATPGPIEMQARDAAAMCNAGHTEACQQALMLQNMAGLERDQRQRDAAAANQAGINAGFLILGAILGAHH
jgi:hypothetical protein